MTWKDKMLGLFYLTEVSYHCIRTFMVSLEQLSIE